MKENPIGFLQLHWLEEEQHGSMICGLDHSFLFFRDVLSDLEQMTNNPIRFLHAPNPNQWKLSSDDDKLNGRDDDTKAFIDAVKQLCAQWHDNNTKR